MAFEAAYENEAPCRNHNQKPRGIDGRYILLLWPEIVQCPAPPTQTPFFPATELEMFEEEIQLIELIDVENMPFYCDHPINVISIDGILPDDRQEMIDAIRYVIEHADQNMLNNSIKRSTL